MTVTQQAPATRPAPAPPRAADGALRRLASLPLVRHLLVAAVGAVVVLVLSETLAPYRNFQLATVAGYLCAAAGLTFLTGLSGQLSLGHGALMAVGAYAAVLTSNELAERDLLAGWRLPVALLAAVLAATVVGFLVGRASTRLSGPYLAGATLAVAVVVPSVATTFRDVLGGDQGLFMVVDPLPDALAGRLRFEQWQVLVSWAVALTVVVLLANAARGRFGRSMRAVRDDEVGARLAGIDVPRTKTTAFAVSAAAAGAGGGLFAFQTQSVAPGAFSMILSLFLLMAVVIGGIGRLAGAVVGAVLLVALPDLASTLGHSLQVGPETAQRLDGNLSLAVLGVTLVVVMLVAPSGLVGTLERWRHRLRTRHLRRAARG
ncbi:branched-chain amino acid ABC transporter permease [Thalassiella azotivora]